MAAPCPLSHTKMQFLAYLSFSISRVKRWCCREKAIASSVDWVDWVENCPPLLAKDMVKNTKNLNFLQSVRQCKVRNAKK